jgi:hypothetical protein
MSPGAAPACDSSPDAAEFVRRFAAGWAGPSPEELLDLLDEHVRLVQPIIPPSTGRAAADATFFRPLLRFIPDLRVKVERWSAAGDVLFIEWTASATLAGREISWPGVDRFVLSGQRAIERVSYFDPLPLLVATLRRPRSWLAFRRSGIRPWRRTASGPAEAPVTLTGPA